MAYIGESARLWSIYWIFHYLCYFLKRSYNFQMAAIRSKEQRILVVMRKLLAQIVKDTTPGPGMRHPLREQTIKDIRDCFGLIAARERELADKAGIGGTERPHFVDEPKTSTVIKFKLPDKELPKDK